jgi:hypothetical protein
MEYQKNEYREPVKQDKTQIIAKILIGLTVVFFLAVLGFIIWVACHVIGGFREF